MLHPHPPQKAKSLPMGDFNSGKQPDNLAASVADYYSGVLKFWVVRNFTLTLSRRDNVIFE